MAKNQLDRELLVASPVFFIGSLTSLGILGPEVFSLDFSNVLWSSGNIRLTLGSLCSIVALGYVFFNRDVGFFEFEGVDWWVVYATAALILAPPLFPMFADSLAQQPAAFIAFCTQGAGFTIVSYKN